MTNLDLEAIRRRAHDVAVYAHSADERRLALEDVPALIAELEQLRRQLAGTCTCPDLDITSLDQPPGNQTTKGRDPACPEHRE